MKDPGAVPGGGEIYDALIVGAGLAGSGMAAGLAGRGWRVLLVERDRLPRHKVCGEFLSHEAQKSLTGLGLDNSVAGLAPVVLGGATLTTPKGRTLALDLPGQAWGISRYALDAALATGAQGQGAELWCETTVTGWQEVEGHTLVKLRRRRGASLPPSTLQTAAHSWTKGEMPAEQEETVTVAARALLVACGRNGFASLLPTASRPHGGKVAHSANVGIKCHFAHVVMPAQVELYLFEGGYVGINPVEDGSANVCALASYDAFARAGRSPRALIEAAALWNPMFGIRLQGAQALPDTECAVAPVDTQRRALPWAGLPLLGDRAAMIPPLCGDGMAMALRSAELCVPWVDGYLRGALAWKEVGARYRHRWHGEFDGRLRVGRVLEQLLLGAQSSTLR